jgi:hypothetical protein
MRLEFSFEVMRRRLRFLGVSLLALFGTGAVLSASCTRGRDAATPEAAATSGVAPAAAPPAATGHPGGPLDAPSRGEQTTSRNAAGAVEAQFRNVDLHVDEDTILHIRTLRGELVSVRKGEPPTFDDRESFNVLVHSAEMLMAAGDLARLMNRHVLAYDGAPLKNLELALENDTLVMKGKVHKGIDVPFSMKATVSASPEGQIKMHATSFKAAKLPAKRLLDLFGVDLADLVKLRNDRGMQMDGDDVLLDPARLLPPPAVRGKVTDARVTPEGLRLVFGGSGTRPAALKLPTSAARNYMYYRGGVLRFGKLTMADADLLLLDADQRDPFDFFQDRYEDQLVAGFSKNTRSMGLIVHMPDYGSVARGRRSTAAIPPDGRSR